MNARFYNGEPDDRDDYAEHAHRGEMDPIRLPGACWNDPATCLCPQCARWREALEVGRKSMDAALRKVG